MAHCVALYTNKIKIATYGTKHTLKQTWSGEWYDFHGECDLVFLSTPEFENGTGLDIHLRTKARYEYSYIEAVAIRIGEGNSCVELYAF